MRACDGVRVLDYEKKMRKELKEGEGNDAGYQMRISGGTCSLPLTGIDRR